MATLDPSTPFTLTNSYTGPTKLLAISATDSRTPQLLSHSNSSSSSSDKKIPPNAEWFLTPTTVPPFYHLHTSLTGPSQALDVLNDNGTSSVRLILSSTSTSTRGQYWRFDIWPDAVAAADDGYIYRITNNYTGEDMHLDVYSDTLAPHLAPGGATGQYWAVSRISSSSSSTATATSTSTSMSEPMGIPPKTGEMSTAAIAGIAIGSVAGLALLVGVVAYLFLSRARRRRRARDMERLYLEGKTTDGQRDSVEIPPEGYERVVAARQGAPVELAAGPMETAELEGVGAVGELDGGRRFSWE
ncbi:hypothetical protein QBC47DRAFT_392329 [Echria macrotheca]|uniref:Uncharacterized protein n=1 Tax=Echria macrotheca TaxID=438768 RepID=A0AAJ0F2H8_9PEZI|nr:hypothetical protein QBC47DRAFT_392329 [Echria macrotheca]